MTTRVEKKWQELRAEGKKAFIPYIMGGDPDLETTAAVLDAAADAGSDIIELGIPFSDPVGDGPVIQEAGQRALAAGVHLRDLFDLVKSFRRKHDTPLVFMTYFNPIFRFGTEAFVEASRQAGVDGFIVPDLPPEEAGELKAACDRAGLHLVYLVAPTCGEARMKTVADHASGFLYYVSRTGVTGMQKALATDLQEKLEALRRLTDLPVVVGFGVSNREQAETIAPMADGVVIGSAIVKLVAESPEGAADRVREFVTPIIESLHKLDMSGVSS